MLDGDGFLDFRISRRAGKFHILTLYAFPHLIFSECPRNPTSRPRGVRHDELIARTRTRTDLPRVAVTNPDAPTPAAVRPLRATVLDNATRILRSSLQARGRKAEAAQLPARDALRTGVGVTDQAGGTPGARQAPATLYLRPGFWTKPFQLPEAELCVLGCACQCPHGADTSGFPKGGSEA